MNWELSIEVKGIKIMVKKIKIKNNYNRHMEMEPCDAMWW